jgi:ABC-type transport system involved in cytochrome c biogenesis ATPase subunit
MRLKDKEGIVDDVLNILGLRDIENSIIGDELNRGISGGQRKRVNIGMELVADPSVLFLDEPTSGLDSASSKDICAAIQSLTQLGMTVRCCAKTKPTSWKLTPLCYRSLSYCTNHDSKSLNCLTMFCYLEKEDVQYIWDPRRML